MGSSFFFHKVHMIEILPQLSLIFLVNMGTLKNLMKILDLISSNSKFYHFSGCVLGVEDTTVNKSDVVLPLCSLRATVLTQKSHMCNV